MLQMTCVVTLASDSEQFVNRKVDRFSNSIAPQASLCNLVVSRRGCHAPTREDQKEGVSSLPPLFSIGTPFNLATGYGTSTLLFL